MAESGTAKVTEGSAQQKEDGRGGKRPKKPSYIASYAYRYGARAPIKNLDLVNHQLYQTHRYRNETVAYERQRRTNVDEELLAIRGAESLATVREEIEEKSAALKELRGRKKLLHMQERNKKVRDPQLEADIESLKEELKGLYDQRKQERRRLFKSVAWKDGNEARKEVYNADQRQLYNSFPDITTSGTRGRVKRDARKLMSGPPPHFKRWDGQEVICLQLSKGITPDALFEGKHKHIRIEPVEGGIWEEGSAKSRGKPPVDPSKVNIEGMRLDADGYAMRNVGNAWVYMRIASRNKTDELKSGGRTPVWTKFAINMHRPLPANTIIKEFFLQRKKIGSSERWYFHCVMNEDTRERVPDPTHATGGYVAIDIGWRLVPCEEGSSCGFRSEDHDDLVHASKCPRKAIRVAYWLGSDGRKGEIRLPSRLVCAQLKMYDLQSIRDSRFNEVRSTLYAWMKDRDDLPQWLREMTKHMHLWHKPVRLVKVVFAWRSQRFAGDDEIFATMEEWRTRDKHLFEYESNLRDQLQNQRKDIYRNAVADLRKRYATVVLEDIDLRKLAARKAPEQAHLEKEAARRYRSFASISILRQCFKEKMEIVKVNPAGTSYLCNHCKHPAFVGSANLVHTCSVCGTIWDRDENAARNILERGMKIALAASA